MIFRYGFLLAALCCLHAADGARVRMGFDDAWRFHLGDVTGGERADFNDAGWRKLNLPHDWSIEQSYSASNPSGNGYLPGGIGWYRKSFSLPASDAARRVSIEFDGVYRDSDVWINGHHLGHRPYGYSSFAYDLTSYVKTGNQPNLVAVRVDHGQAADSRWYTGSGIYRHVWLTVTAPVHIAHWGTYVRTPVVNADEALVSIETTIVSESASESAVSLVTAIKDESGQVVATVSSNASLKPAERRLFAQQAVVANPKVWDLTHPNLYTAESQVSADGTPVDESRTEFGIRTIRFDANTGFYLNGRPEKLKGVCIHHDLGALGAAFNEAALERRLKLLKQIGVNAIRCSHNPMAPELYAICDRLGLLVMDEGFDEWMPGKNKWVQGRNTGTPSHDGYNQAFDEWAVRDISDMVSRDRNHPSVILWSIGNEIDYPNDPFSHPRGRGGIRPNAPSADQLPPIARRLISAIKLLDGTRPVTQALADIQSSNATGLASLLDVVGYNYLEQNYARDHQTYPERIILGSENSHSPAAWQTVAQNPWVAGQFLWTGVDYLGESNRYPDRGSTAGLLDYCGFRKPESYLREALWGDRPMVYAAAREPAPAGGRGAGRLVEHWNWAEDLRQTIPVEVYTRCSSVELSLNGRSLGTKSIPSLLEPVLRWEVPNEPGTVRAVGKWADQPGECAHFELATAGAPARLELTADRVSLMPHGDLASIEIRVVDASGRRVFPSALPITVTVTGAELAALDNSDPRDVTSVKAGHRTAYQGRILALVRTGSAEGEVTVLASAVGLPAAEIRLQVIGPARRNF